MKEVFQVNLNVRFFVYNTQEEMKEHIKIMKHKNWNCIRHGKMLIDISNCTTEHFLDDNNWKWCAEYYIEKIDILENENINYETDSYCFYVDNCKLGELV